MAVDDGPARRGWRRLFAAETPARLRLFGVAVGALVIAWTAVAVVETQRARSGLAVIGQRRAPVVTAASDLYFVLNDMDAQLANVLLVGDETRLGVTRNQALNIFETRRAQGDADLQMVLQQARAVSYDANADESRYLLDPHRAEGYQQAFQAKTQQVLGLDGATLTTFDQRFAAALRAYQDDNRQVGWGGYLGSEFRNITFVGERAAAERVVESYQIYQADDRQIRRLAAGGQQRAAISLCTSYAPGGSNYSFDRYDSALVALIGINQQAFRTAVHDDQRSLALWQFVPGAGAFTVLVLLFLGLRPRLAEYR